MNIHPKLFNHTQDEISFSIVNQQNQLESIPSGSLYLAATYRGKNDKTLIMLCNDYAITDKVVTFNYSTNSYQFISLIRGDEVEVQLEIGVVNGQTQKVILSDFGYASQRCYIQGMMPEPVDLDSYYTKTEIDAILSGYTTKAYVDSQDSQLSGVISSHIIDSTIHVTSTEKTNWDGKQDQLTASNKLDYSLISGHPGIPTKTSDLENDSDFQTGDDVSTSITQSISGKADSSTLTAHTSDSTIHVTATDKTNWDGKQNQLTATNKLDYSLISGHPGIPTKTSDLENDSDFQTGDDVSASITQSISGKADSSTLTAHTSDSIIHVTSTNKTNWDGKISNPSGGAVGQVLKKTASGVEWGDDEGGNPVYVSLETKDCVTAGTFIAEFTGKQIQRYNATNATSGTITINYTAFVSSANDIAPTVEVQIPVNGEVTTINIPSELKVVSIPTKLEYVTSSTVTYHDFVARAEKNTSGDWQYYINYAYEFTE